MNVLSTSQYSCWLLLLLCVWILLGCYSYLVVFTHWRWVFSIEIYLHCDNKTFKIPFIFANTPLITTILSTIIYSLHMRSLEFLNIYKDSINGSTELFHIPSIHFGHPVLVFLSKGLYDLTWTSTGLCCSIHCNFRLWNLKCASFTHNSFILMCNDPGWNQVIATHFGIGHFRQLSLYSVLLYLL